MVECRFYTANTAVRFCHEVPIRNTFWVYCQPSRRPALEAGGRRGGACYPDHRINCPVMQLVWQLVLQTSEAGSKPARGTSNKLTNNATTVIVDA